jgi:hypothetical protein
MRAILLIIISTFVISCNQEAKLNLHPLESNLELNREDIEKLGFELFSADHGLCMYDKQFDSLLMYFILDSDDDCSAIKVGGVEFPFDEFDLINSEDSSKVIYGEYPMDVYNDSIKISAIITELGGQIVSNKKGYKDLVNLYDVKNKATNQIFSASINYKIDSKKYLTIESE